MEITANFFTGRMDREVGIARVTICIKGMFDDQVHVEATLNGDNNENFLSVDSVSVCNGEGCADVPSSGAPLDEEIRKAILEKLA